MNYENIIIAFFGLIGGGAAIKFFQWFTHNNQTVAEGWRAVAKSLEDRMNRMEKAYTERINELEELVQRREELYLQTLGKKDLEIISLREEVATLRHEVNNLRATQQITSDVQRIEVEAAKSGLHQAVEDNIEKLKT